MGSAGTVNVTTIFDYDNNGNLISSNAPLGRNTIQGYDELDRLTTVTDPAGKVTTFEYDALDQLISVTDPRSFPTTYTYNGLGEVKKLVSRDTGTTNYVYDFGGNLKQSTDARGVVAKYTHDKLNRRISADFTLNGVSDQTIAYTYDERPYGIGRLSGVSDSAHSMSWSYDAQGRVTNTTQVLSGVSQNAAYGYTDGQLTSIVRGAAAVAVGERGHRGTRFLGNVEFFTTRRSRRWHIQQVDPAMTVSHREVRDDCARKSLVSLNDTAYYHVVAPVRPARLALGIRQVRRP